MLSILIFAAQIPRDSEFKGYRKSRYTLGLGFIIISLYCIFRTLQKQEFYSYVDFWVLIEVSLLFSWLNYTAFLYLIKTNHRVRQHFLIDGIMPLVLMTILGFIGLVYKSAQEWICYIFGLIFLAKSGWMFYTCDKEWLKVSKDLENNYDASPNILWMRRLVWLSLVLSIFTLMAWYIPCLQVVYATSGPIIFLYMVLKLVNYNPQKICEMRNENTPAASSTVDESDRLSKNIANMLEPKIKQWVEDKKFCRANLSIKDVALELGTNHSYLSKYINNNLNMTFQVWLNTLRIDESKQILSTENISIEEVGIKVGIPLSYNFSRWFKTITGETPFKYRQHLNKREA